MEEGKEKQVEEEREKEEIEEEETEEGKRTSPDNITNRPKPRRIS